MGTLSLQWLSPIVGGGVLLGLISYVLLAPEKAERIAGWIWRGISMVWKSADKRAVGYRVQGRINQGRADLLKKCTG